MKRIIIITLLSLVPLGAAAQSMAVGRLAAKWEDRKDLSVVIINGLPGKGAKLNGVEGVDISQFISEMSGITIVSNEHPDEEFAADVRRVVDEGNYTEFMSVSEGGERVKILYGELPGADKGKKELIITVNSRDKITLISVVGKININK
jgi:hypothetical protein